MGGAVGVGVRQAAVPRGVDGKGDSRGHTGEEHDRPPCDASPVRRLPSGSPHRDRALAHHRKSGGGGDDGETGGERVDIGRLRRDDEHPVDGHDGGHGQGVQRCHQPRVRRPGLTLGWRGRTADPRQVGQGQQRHGGRRGGKNARHHARRGGEDPPGRGPCEHTRGREGDRGDEPGTGREPQHRHADGEAAPRSVQSAGEQRAGYRGAEQRPGSPPLEAQDRGVWHLATVRFGARRRRRPRAVSSRTPKLQGHPDAAQGRPGYTSPDS